MRCRLPTRRAPLAIRRRRDRARVDALSEGGEVQLPLGETFFSPAFGMCTDRFGIPWMVIVEGPMAP
jgi:PhnB protein